MKQEMMGGSGISWTTCKSFALYCYYYYYNRFTAPWTVWDYPGEPVPER